MTRHHTDRGMKVLTVNAGSSSLKLRVLDPDDQVLGSRDADTDGDVAAQVAQLLDETGPVDASGHRVVHGGAQHVDPERVTDALLDDLRALVPLAPLHQPAALDGIAVVQAALPRVPAVACFDTAFPAHLPPPAAAYAVPRQWRDRFGLRRYGAHGLSHAYASRRAAEMTNGRAPRVVVAHLGSGASLCAVHGGRSVDTTMGFTPMEGLVMATRSGSVDPGLLLWLITDAGLSPEQVQDGIDRQGGLLGLTGSQDMQEVLARAHDDDDAQLAVGVYVHRLAAGIAAMTASLRGLDVLVFTGGVGERASVIRAAAGDRLTHLGVDVDPARNETAQPDCDVSADRAAVRTLMVAAREDIEIAASTRVALGG